MSELKSPLSTPGSLMTLLVGCCGLFSTYVANAEKPAKTDPSPVTAELIVKQAKYVMLADHEGQTFRDRIEKETDCDKLPAAPKIHLVMVLKNISNEDVMIFPCVSIDYPELTVTGKGVVEPLSLMSFSGSSSGGSVQPVIKPGKTYRFKLKSLNPNGGTPMYYWCEPGEYSITAEYKVYTNLPPFPFTDGPKPQGKPKSHKVTAPAVKVKVVSEGEKA